MLTRIRRYWDIESGLHQRLDVSGGEDSSRVRNRNTILVLGKMRRTVMGDYYAMNRFNHRLAFATITVRNP